MPDVPEENLVGAVSLRRPVLSTVRPGATVIITHIRLGRAAEIETNSVSEDFNGTLLCMVAMVARHYLNVSRASVNHF